MLSPGTFKFLKELAKHNDRDWFALNKTRYDEARLEVIGFVGEILKKSSAFEPALKELKPEKCVMRIYRDVRFSKNKDPYKRNFGIAFSPHAKGVEGPGYYLHIQPGASFFGAGYWLPQAPHLKMIRQEIDYHADEFRSILQQKSFKKLFGDLSQEDKLKTAPKDYPKDHPEIEWLKLKSFIAASSFSDEKLCSPKATDQVVQAVKAVKPLIDFLQRAIEQ